MIICESYMFEFSGSKNMKRKEKKITMIKNRVKFMIYKKGSGSREGRWQ